MNSRRLVYRGLTYFRLTHLAAAFTAAVTAAVIVAALAVGDSVRSGMRRVAESRGGRVGFAAHARGRTWREELTAALAGSLDARVSGALLLSGSASLPDGSARVAGVRVIGVDDAFWSLSPGGRAPLDAWPEDGVLVSESVAARLGLAVGDSLIVRMEKPADLPRGGPLSPDSDATAMLSGTVAGVIDADAFGHFALEIGAIPPANVFLPLARLQEAVGEPGRVNTLLIEAGAADEGTINAAVAGAWRLGDAGLTLTSLDGGRGLELRSRRVILDPPAGDAALAVEGAAGVLTWLVNGIALGERSTPYSLVAALPKGVGPVPADLDGDEIVLNQWLAEDLGAGVGDIVHLTYFVPGQLRRLEEHSVRLGVRAVVPVGSAGPDLMPDIPGLTDSEDCRDWDPGFALDLSLIRDKDEAYWDEHGGTPKAFVELESARQLWGSRYGSLTAVRFPPDTEVEGELRAALDPAAFGLGFTDLRAAGAAARGQGMDFGSLFLGFSAFLVIAALLLMGLVVALNVSMRRREIGILLALGFTPRRVRLQFAVEHAVVALVGGIGGSIGGLALGTAALAALGTVWSDVAGSLDLSLVARPETVIAGALSGATVSFGAAYLVLARTIRRSVVGVIARNQVPLIARRRGCLAAGIASAFAVAATVLALTAGTGRDPATAGAFFGSGAMLLVATLVFIWFGLARVGASGERGTLSGPGLAWRNLGRRRGRSVAVIGVLAFGVFMFFGVSVFRRDRLSGPGEKTSGTGGFDLVGTTSVAVVGDVDTEEGGRAHALTEAAVVSLRVRGGDDASCRNLMRPQAPPVLGVDPGDFQDRFTFLQIAKERDFRWGILCGREPAPAVIDQATLWTLGKGLGETIELTDERGRPFLVRIAGVIDNSILNGHLIIWDVVFDERFPSEGGARLFLIDTEPESADEVAAKLTRQLTDLGMSIERSEDRLNAYNAVENTYLGIFQALGGIGLLLGSAGLALVVGRNVLERRGELAFLSAVGFTRRRIEWLVTMEHAVLLFAGLLAGVLASLVAVIPALLAPGAWVANPLMGWTLLALAVGGLLWTRLAARRALRAG